MAGLTMDYLTGDLKSAAQLIDQKHYFPDFDEAQFTQLAALAQEIQAEVEELHGDLAELKAKTAQAAAGALERGMHTELAEASQDAQSALADWGETAAALAKGADWVQSRRAGFFKIVLVYWQQAQSFGCPNPGSLDAVLMSDTYGVLEEARRAWEGMVENYEA
ncbi:MAG: hypothetical protein ACRC20_06720 [Segniliparus sp.]|uniref:hypothetical protein n=1 Tax=Segniliparus sp. TaxID=2804064 RepID=UPI003F40EAB4